MNAKAFFDCIQKRELQQLYLLHGEEEYAKDRAIEQIIESVDQVTREFNLDWIEKVEIQSLIMACEALPMMAEKRFVFVRDSSLFSDNAAQVQPLTQYLDQICPSTCLIFVVREKCDERKALFKAIAKKGEIVEFALYSESEAAAWACGFAKKRGVILPKELAFELVMMASKRLDALASETTKLCDYAGEGNTITREMLDTCVQHNLEYTVFEMLSLFLSKQTGRALILLHDTLEKQGNAALIATLMFFASRFRNMLTARQALDLGQSAKQAALAIGGNPYAAQKSVQAAGRFSLCQLEEALVRFGEIDVGIKNGKVKGELALELALIEVFA